MPIALTGLGAFSLFLIKKLIQKKALQKQSASLVVNSNDINSNSFKKNSDDFSRNTLVNVPHIKYEDLVSDGLVLDDKNKNEDAVNAVDNKNIEFEDEVKKLMQEYFKIDTAHLNLSPDDEKNRQKFYSYLIAQDGYNQKMEQEIIQDGWIPGLLIEIIEHYEKNKNKLDDTFFDELKKKQQLEAKEYSESFELDYVNLDLYKKTFNYLIKLKKNEKIDPAYYLLLRDLEVLNLQKNVIKEIADVLDESSPEYDFWLKVMNQVQNQEEKLIKYHTIKYSDRKIKPIKRINIEKYKEDEISMRPKHKNMSEVGVSRINIKKLLGVKTIPDLLIEDLDSIQNNKNLAKDKKIALMKEIYDMYQKEIHPDLEFILSNQDGNDDEYKKVKMKQLFEKYLKRKYEIFANY